MIWPGQSPCIYGARTRAKAVIKERSGVAAQDKAQKVGVGELLFSVGAFGEELASLLFAKWVSREEFCQGVQQEQEPKAISLTTSMTLET